MRSLLFCAVSGVAVSLLVAACGDDGGTGGGEATSVTTSNVTTAPSTSSPSSSSTGTSGCTPVSAPLEFLGPNTWQGQLTDPIGGSAPDYLLLYVGDVSGTINLSLPTDATVCFDTTACVGVAEDADANGIPAKFYMADAGTLELGSTTPPFYIAGSLSNVNLVEVTVDDLQNVTQVDPGECTSIASLVFQFDPPAPGWSCNPLFYGDMDGCDCTCGAYDPDCDDPMQEILGCQVGQTCDMTGACAGAPAAWACPLSEYAGGAGNGCDCNCGAHDPDCDLPGEVVQGPGCEVGAVCTAADVCPPLAWDCLEITYGSDDGCDCGCGVLDPDCMGDATVGACDYCDDPSSCSAAPCPANIDPVNNAVCI